VGGIDYKEFKYDHVKQGKRQVGSTFKPIIYATAIREGFSPCLEIPKVPTTFEKGTFNLQEDWTPQDSDHNYGFMATLKWGLANSVNTMTSYLMKQFGPDPVVKLARDMGIKSDLLPVPSLCLGVADLSVYEITAANSVFVNQGVYIEPIIITRIEDKSGNSIYDVTPVTNEALDPRTAQIMLEMMKGTVDGVYNRHKDRSSGTAMRLRMDLDSRKGHKDRLQDRNHSESIRWMVYWNDSRSGHWYLGRCRGSGCSIQLSSVRNGNEYGSTYLGLLY
jgi:penicillin-binding protein 1A